MDEQGWHEVDEAKRNPELQDKQLEPSALQVAQLVYVAEHRVHDRGGIK
jgi:hypothetical protein